MPLTTTQKALVDRFAVRTGADKRKAERYLKNANFDLDAAIRAYTGVSPGVSAQSLKDQFESIRDAAEDPVDKIGANNTMQYLTDIGVNVEDASLLYALDVLKAESFGELTKTGFVDGWLGTTVSAADTNVQRSYMVAQIPRLSTDTDLFKNAYRHTFLVAREGDARAISLDMAITFWEILFKAPGRPWVGKQTGIDWLAEWTEFLQAKWTRTISKDMWNQTLEFAAKSVDDESLSFWSEEASWPGVIDQFVLWYREKTNGGAAMEVDS